MRHSLVAALLLLLASSSALAQARANAMSVTSASPTELRAWDQQVDQMVRAGELRVRPLSDGYHLAYYARAATPLDQLSVFVDANDGHVLRQYSEFISEIVAGKGIYGDDKKVSASSGGGARVASDTMRPGPITTYDMKGDFTHTTNVLNGFTPVAPSDVEGNTS